ncbi:MAG: cell division ATP-binding protein FtsE [Candidatus Fimivivens sp.]|jgi:cell division transport system ATP-binding protein|nr:cell division ATP-binding protein FtsE [Oscillospiraceae bacterium]MEA5137073.1 cell division ATP-binding protein FtsE [Candidatus Fimivivens sp.]
MIEFQNVSKSYGGPQLALNDVSFSVEKGEFLFVVGSSGSGKSTMLKLITREEAASSGKVYVDGCDVGKLRRSELPYYRRGIGVVFQDFRLIPQMSVYDNVAFAMRVTNVATREIKRRVPYVLDLVGLLPKVKRFPEQLSGGEQQRVALARALVNNPSLIIADEPTGNIDPAMSFEIVELLSEINKCGTTVMMVTHEHNLVNKFRHRTIVINGGHLVADGHLGGKRARQ